MCDWIGVSRTAKVLHPSAEYPGTPNSALHARRAHEFCRPGRGSVAGMPAVEPAANLSYSGQLTIVAKHGTLGTNHLGVLDAAHLAFTEMERPASGTGVFANPGSSVFFISGAIIDNGQGFQGNLSGTGTICADGDSPIRGASPLYFCLYEVSRISADQVSLATAKTRRQAPGTSVHDDVS
jgi:hypothetical protein